MYSLYSEHYLGSI